MLRRLAAQGVVSAERVGPAFAYRLNRAHLAAEPITALAGIRATFLTRLEQLLASWSLPAAYAAVFGSAGRGTMRPDSDIDLLLVRSDGPDDTWDAQVNDLVSTVSAWTGNDLRPLVYTLAELAASRGEPVLLDILVSGVTVAGQRSWFQRHVRAPESEVVHGQALEPAPPMCAAGGWPRRKDFSKRPMTWGCWTTIGSFATPS